MQNARITLHPSKQRMHEPVDGILLVETIESINTLELCEQGYLPRQYFSREDVRMTLFDPRRPFRQARSAVLYSGNDD